ncbi:MAG: UDP-N-acetylmuramoyl-tripeptide--D-alanyl-D-alanine ligase, partial [Myxococcota bacterium]
GDMLELGRKAVQLHKDMGVVAADMDVDILYAVGQHNEDYATGFYGDKVVCGDDADEIVEHLRGVVKAGDWVLVKGSRGMRMERVVAALSGGGAS